MKYFRILHLFGLALCVFLVNLFVFLTKVQPENGSHKDLSAAIVSFVHDERDILDYWIQYHSKIVGVQNIAIIDHNSPSESKRILEKWERRGLIVVRGNFSYFEKGPVTLNVYKEYFPHVELAVPLDADEILFGLMPIERNVFNLFGSRYSRGSFSADYIRKQLVDFSSSDFTCISILDIFNNCNIDGNEQVNTTHVFSTIPPEFAYWRKRIWKLSALQELDHGSHHGVFHGKCTIPHTLGLLHYHNRNVRLKVQRALNDLIGFGYANKTDTLESIKKKSQHFHDLMKVSSLWGAHKVHEIIVYLEKGLESLVSPCPVGGMNSFSAPTLDRIAVENGELQTEPILLDKRNERKYFDKKH
jgi:hypothetical protein